MCEQTRISPRCVTYFPSALHSRFSYYLSWSFYKKWHFISLLLSYSYFPGCIEGFLRIFLFLQQRIVFFCNFPVFGHLEKAPFRTARAVEWPCCILKGSWVWWEERGKEGVQWFSSCTKHDEVRIKSSFACSKADLRIRVIILYITPNAVCRTWRHQTACLIGKPA